MVRPYPPNYGQAVPRHVAEQLAGELERTRQIAASLQRERDHLEGALRKLERRQQDLRLRLEEEHQERERLAAQLDVLVADNKALRASPPKVEEAPCADDERVARLTADLANLRRRQQVTVETEVRNARRAQLEEMFNLRDTLERSLSLSGDPDSPWHQGTERTLAQLDASLSRLGLARLGHDGEPFDPSRHEAVGSAPGADGTIANVVRPGWLDGENQVLRPALVMVGDGSVTGSAG